MLKIFLVFTTIQLIRSVLAVIHAVAPAVDAHAVAVGADELRRVAGALGRGANLRRFICLVAAVVVAVTNVVNRHTSACKISTNIV